MQIMTHRKKSTAGRRANGRGASKSLQDQNIETDGQHRAKNRENQTTGPQGRGELTPSAAAANKRQTNKGNKRA